MSRFATQALMAKHAYVAALLAGTAAVAGAQTMGSPPAGMQGSHPGMMQHGRAEHGTHDPAKMQAYVAKRQAELKAKLNLTPEQEGSWATFTAAMKPPTQPPQGMTRPNPAEMEKLTTPERIDKMRAMREQRQAIMASERSKREEATKTFYATLNAEQKKVFDTEALKWGARHHGAHQG